jgi:septum site-determining protein MinC
MTKQQLMALVLDLQAQEPAAGGPKDAASEAIAEVGPAESPRPQPNSLVITSSVRSGQTIEFLLGDVTVIGSVGSGAEIVAGGSIHVYGTLRGRAIAGTSGDRSARIFCQSLKAELLSIDGCYRVAENFDPRLRGTAVQARLDGLKMALEPLAGGENSGAGTSATGLQRRAADRFMSLISKSTMSRTQPTARFS